MYFVVIKEPNAAEGRTKQTDNINYLNHEPHEIHERYRLNERLSILPKTVLDSVHAVAWHPLRRMGELRQVLLLKWLAKI